MHALARFILLAAFSLSAFSAVPPERSILEKVAHAYRAKEPAQGIPSGLAYEDALTWQKEFIQLLEPAYGPVAGYKVGLVTPAGQQRFGISHPVRGALLREMLTKNNSIVRGKPGTRPILEADLIVRVKDDGINDARTIEEAARHLSEVVAFIELADNIFATNITVDAGMLVAGNVGARSGIIGESRQFESTPEFIRAFGEMSIVLERDGRELSRVKANGVLGHPLNAVVWLVEDMKRTGERLKAGQWLSLGSPSPQESPKPGEQYRLIYEGLPGGPLHASVQFEGKSASLELPATDEGLPGQGPIRRYDWFRRLWNERRARWAGRVEQDRNAVVLLGDSITQGWGEDFSAWFPGMKVANRGISGDTSRGVLIRLEGDVLALDPQAVVLLIGTNDLEEKAEPETIAANLKLILAEFERHNPKMPVVLCEVFPSSASKSRPSEKIKKLNQLYAQAVKGNPQVILLETWPLFANEKGDAIPAEFPDLLHPNMAGYAKWAAALRPVLATLGFLEKQTYQFTPEPGFVSLFNGTNLTGWGFRATSEAEKESIRKWKASDPNMPAWPLVTETVSFDGQESSPDGRYVAKNGRLIVTTPPEGRRIQQLSTTHNFSGNFTLRLEFRATPNADSGIFVCGPQLQCRDYPLAGPYKKLKNYRPGDWNEIEVTVRNGTAFCQCNGEVIESAMKIPPSGPIGLEGDRGQMEYRRIRIKMETPNP